MKENLASDYWNNRYKSEETAWDLGVVSPPIKKYIDQLKNKELKILIPGAGNAYEAIYLLQNGFKNVTVIDFASLPLKNLKSKLTDINETHYQLINDDFFNHQGEYNLILEQTFFCAIDPLFRPKYVDHCYQLLRENGKLVGVLFNKEFPFEGPPFGGSEKEYVELFKDKFRIIAMEMAHNSATPRQGSELFINFCVKK
ncbi:SAM-dependent methyltransferase [Pedobacter psychrophilus]|uniref:SAM-dependent methyltransferase n=1 Tax=Pedobacter psychrophilus TaxID=1826909 RepID=A0A179DBD1_9SPHI|nr:SAM-dependent methyltransferase [Pedobacter psychrophilus]OAQ38298.1 SAM-dependent methyltransferase [Pedobacter psychrophilus]